MVQKSDSKRKNRVLMMLVVAATLIFSGAFSTMKVEAEEPTVVTDLEQFVTAINAGKTDIVLGGDVTFTSNDVEIASDLTLDLSGHTINLMANKLIICADVTIKDSSQNETGKIHGARVSDTSSEILTRCVIIITDSGKLTLESGTIEGIFNRYGIVLTDNSSLDIKGGYITVIADGIVAFDKSSVEISGGTVEASNNAIQSHENTYLYVKGGNVKTRNMYAFYIRGKALISDVTVETTTYGGIVVNETGSLTIEGGNVKAKRIALYIWGYADIKGGSFVAETDTVFVANYHTAYVKEDMLVIEDGLIEATGDGAAIKMDRYAGATIKGGTIKALYSDVDQKTGGIGIEVNDRSFVTINGGTIKSCFNAISGNDSDDGTKPWLHISGGTVNSEYGAGIYAPQIKGITEISGGTITGGGTGVEVRSGSLNITGGTITGNQEGYNCTDCKDGLPAKGCAVSVVQDSNKRPIDVNISGGTFYGYLPFGEVNAYGNEQADVEKINYDISGGVFVSSGDKTVNVEDMYNGQFISGGYFTHYVTGYVKDGYGETITYVKAGEKEYPNYKLVTPWRSVTLDTSANGSAKITRNKITYSDGTKIETKPDKNSITGLEALKTDVITIDASPKEGYEIDKITFTDEEGNVTDVTDDAKFEMPDCNVTVNVTFKVAPPPTPTPTPEPTATPTLTPTPESTSTPEVAPTSETTPTVTPTPEENVTPTPSVTPTATPTKVEDLEKIIKEMQSEADLDGAEFIKCKLKITKIAKHSISYKWNKVEGATKYVIYANKCNKKNKCTKIDEVTTTKYTLDKVNGKKLKKGTYYKLLIVAADDENNVLATSKVVHAATKGGKVTNYKSIAFKKNKNIKNGKLALKKGKSFKLKVKTTKADKKKKLHVHRKVSFESDNTAVATVSKSGKIKAVGKGTCKIYAYTQNGLYKTLTVTVK